MASTVMDKSPDAFRTISEVAEDLDLPQHVLRFWETRFAPIKPLKRGGGRRYYRPDDIDLLKGIRHLLYGEGYTIRGVQRILKAEGVRFVQAIGRGEQSVAPQQADPSEAPDDDLGEEALDEPSRSHGALVSLSRPALQVLQVALSELLECDRVLSSLRTAVEPTSND
jgi:DNA-binding transcriptional MerR regulator